MLRLRYDPTTGEAVRDERADRLARDFISLSSEDRTVDLVYGTENIFYAVRILIQEGKIDPGNIQIQFRDTLIQVNRRGDLSEWPEGFCDYTDRWLEKLIGWKVDNH